MRLFTSVEWITQAGLFITHTHSSDFTTAVTPTAPTSTHNVKEDILHCSNRARIIQSRRREQERSQKLSSLFLCFFNGLPTIRTVT